MAVLGSLHFRVSFGSHQFPQVWPSFNFIVEFNLLKFCVELLHLCICWWVTADTFAGPARLLALIILGGFPPALALSFILMHCALLMPTGGPVQISGVLFLCSSLLPCALACEF